MWAFLRGDFPFEHLELVADAGDAGDEGKSHDRLRRMERLEGASLDGDRGRSIVNHRSAIERSPDACRMPGRSFGRTHWSNG